MITITCDRCKKKISTSFESKECQRLKNCSTGEEYELCIDCWNFVEELLTGLGIEVKQ